MGLSFRWRRQRAFKVAWASIFSLLLLLLLPSSSRAWPTPHDTFLFFLPSFTLKTPRRGLDRRFECANPSTLLILFLKYGIFFFFFLFLLFICFSSLSLVKCFVPCKKFEWVRRQCGPLWLWSNGNLRMNNAALLSVNYFVFYLTTTTSLTHTARIVPLCNVTDRRLLCLWTSQ